MDKEKELNRLPIGSVVLLKDAEKKAMIIGNGGWDKKGHLFDYYVCAYPEGMVPGVGAIDNYDIEKVISIGYYDEEAKEFELEINKIHNDNPKAVNPPINHLKDLEIDENGYIPEVGKEPNEYLPIGSVVTLKDYPDQKKIIIGHVVNEKGSNEIYDYVCSVYPYGYNPNDVAYINGEDILDIYSIGYYDKEQEEYMDYVDEESKQIKNEKGGFFRR